MGVQHSKGYYKKYIDLLSIPIYAILLPHERGTRYSRYNFIPKHFKFLPRRDYIMLKYDLLGQTVVFEDAAER